ncbi:MAG TPA: hypothetical protein VGW74_17960 [Propionibacteriaceae bacterium]|nr:hypothetical protein [Propionibacteriaceae bacterium]
MEGMTVGLAMVIPAIALAVLLRHPRAAGRPPAASERLNAECATPQA